MKARRYEPDDFEQIEKWAKGWDTTYRAHQFPKTGFIVDGLAAYFLYKTDSSVCFLENLISNKGADDVFRQRAIREVTQAVLKEAEALGFRVAYATTDVPSVILRAAGMGCTIDPKQTLITKTLIPAQLQ